MIDGKIVTNDKVITEKVIKNTGAITAHVYNKACNVVGYTNAELNFNYYDDKITDKELFNKREALDAVYRELLCKLSTKNLNLILAIHNAGRVIRTNKTLDSIVTELLERELNNA